MLHRYLKTALLSLIILKTLTILQICFNPGLKHVNAAFPHLRSPGDSEGSTHTIRWLVRSALFWPRDSENGWQWREKTW